MILAENQINNCKKAIEVSCPINAKIGRVLVIQIQHEYEEGEQTTESLVPVIKKGDLWLPKHSIAATEAKNGLDTSNEVVPAIIKSIGANADGSFPENLAINELVYVFPSVFETKISIEGTDYMAYSHRDIVAGVNTGVDIMKPAKE